MDVMIVLSQDYQKLIMMVLTMRVMDFVMQEIQMMIMMEFLMMMKY